MKKCVFAGTFDPPTVGHKSVIDDCLKIFDSVTVAVMNNPQKSAYFTAKERETLLQKLYKGDKRVKIITFSGAAADLLKAENTPFYVRGVRNTVDFEYENANNFASRKINADMVTVYLPPKQEEIFISSTLVKNCFRFGKDYSKYVPAEIYGDIEELFKSGETERKDV